jgi:hypothetical protein
MDFSSIGLFIGPLLTAVPFALMMLVGAAIALVRRKHHPRASMLAMFGFGGFALTSLCVSVVNPLLIMSLNQNSIDSSTTASAMAGFSIITTLVNLVWWGLIIAAMFVDRPKRDAL